jgi:hypothetical protein
MYVEKREVIGKYEICLNRKTVRTFVGDALFEEASSDEPTEKDAEKFFERVCDYCRKR